MNESQKFLATSIYGAMHDRPMVELRYTGTFPIQISPVEARALAFSILEAAESAEYDAIVYRWAQRIMGLTVQQAAQIMREFRVLRVQVQAEQSKPEQAPEV